MRNCDFYLPKILPLKLNKYSIFAVLLLLVSSSLTIANVEATTISISIDKTIYSYGDYLSIDIQVSELTEEFAILYITDQFGKKSSAINIPITELESTMTAPIAFESTIYGEGIYKIDIQYAGAADSIEFELIDSGTIVIPNWIKDFSRYWLAGTISDNEFASGIEFLIKEGIIVVSETQSQQKTDEVIIPEWIKINTQWWTERKISDTEFAAGIEYLIKNGIIMI